MSYADKYKGMYANKSRFLKAQDIDSPPVIVTVDSFADEELDGDVKLAIQFAEYDKTLILNQTNYNAMASMFRSYDPQDWLGKECLLQVEAVTYQGKTVDAIRVKAHAQPRRAQRSQEPEKKRAEPMRSDFDDDIPFGDP